MSARCTNASVVESIRLSLSAPASATAVLLLLEPEPVPELAVTAARPPVAATMRFWLGESRRLVPQASGDLGARLAASLRAVVPGRGWLAMAADCPGLDAELLLEHLREPVERRE